MNTSNDRIQSLKELLSLEEKRAQAQAALDAIVTQIERVQVAVLGGSAVSAAKPAAAPAISRPAPVVARAGRKGKAPRGTLKESVIKLLQATGSKGISVKEVASALNTKPANIHAFFHSTGKRIAEIKKLDGAVYAWIGSGAGSASATTPVKKAGKPGRPPKAAPVVKATKAVKAVKPVKAPKAAKAAKSAGKGGRSRRGALTEKIIATLKAAGSSGISLNDLSEKVGVKYKNLSIWFATTGKKVPGVQRVGPGTYAIKK